MNPWIKKDLKFIWHPYTQMKDCRRMPPLLMTRGRGIRLYDEKGRFYYDTISSWWCNVHGHNHPKIKAAVKKQLNALEHTLFAGLTHKPAIRLAEQLIRLTPKNLTKVFFSDNGSTAVETALKMSFQFWQNMGRPQKTKFVSLNDGYHGDTIGAMSLSGVDLFNEKYRPLFFPSFKAPSPNCLRCPVGRRRETCRIECIKPLKAIFKKHQKKIAAMILEPLVMAAGGMIIYPPAYLLKARALTKKYGIHLILDEVATGFGRTGKMFACDHAGVSPEFMCLSKGITAGYLPLGATLTTKTIYGAFYADYSRRRTFYHGHTYTANPLACAAALASLKIFKEEATLKRVRQNAAFLRHGLLRFNDLPCVGDIRSLGMIAALELVKDKKRKTPFRFEERIGLKVYTEGLKEHLLLRPLGDVIYLFLPLCAKKRDLADILDKTFNVIQKIT